MYLQATRVGVGMFVIARIPYEREHVALLSREWHIRCGGLDSPTRCDVITIEELYVWRGGGGLIGLIGSIGLLRQRKEKDEDERHRKCVKGIWLFHMRDNNTRYSTLLQTTDAAARYCGIPTAAHHHTRFNTPKIRVNMFSHTHTHTPILPSSPFPTCKAIQ